MFNVPMSFRNRQGSSEAFANLADDAFVKIEVSHEHSAASRPV